MDLASAYVLAYSFSYFCTVVSVKRPTRVFPEPINENMLAGRLFIFILGSGLAVSALTRWWFVVLPMACFMAWSVATQWWNIIVWNIPNYPEGPDSKKAKGMHQCFMATWNLICAVALFTML